MPNPIMIAADPAPALAKGFANIADVFAPASARDAYYGVETQAARAKMMAEQQKAQRLNDVYTRGTAAGATPQSIDLAAIAAGLYNPNQSTYAVDLGDTTKRRGQDLESGDRRFDVTSRDTTSRLNNTDDNNRALNVAIMQPTPEGATVVRPPALADRFAVPQQSTGVIKLNQGQTATPPPGPGGAASPVLQGLPPNLTESEMKAIILQRMDRPAQEAAAFGSTPLETTMVDGNPKTVSRPQLLASGNPAVPKDQRGEYFNYVAPGGQTGTAVHDPVRNALVDAQTKQPLPAGVKIQSAAGVVAPNPIGTTTSNVTEANRKAAQLDEFDAGLAAYEDMLKKNPGIVGVPGAVRGVAQNAVSVAQEFAGAFKNIAPQAPVAADQVKQIAASLGAAHRDPAIAQARVMEADLAYKWAQMQNPTGEVSRQAFERGLDAVTGSDLRNNQSALESVAGMREVSKRARIGVNALRVPQNVPNPAPAPTPQRGANGAPAGPYSVQTPGGTVTITPVQ